jgi:hypothetical protein
VATSFLAGIDCAAAEHDDGPLRVPQKVGRTIDRRRRRAGRPGQRPRIERQMAGLAGDHVDRDLDVHRTRPRAGKQRERAGQDLGQLLCPQQGVAEPGDAGDHVPLRRQLVQPPLAHAQVLGAVDARDDQHRHRLGIGLAHGGQDVGHARPGDDEADAGPAAHPGIAVGHEPRPLLVPRRDVPDPGRRQAAVELDRVHARDAEHRIDAMGLEQLDEHFTAGGHG